MKRLIIFVFMLFTVFYINAFAQIVDLNNVTWRRDYESSSIVELNDETYYLIDSQNIIIKGPFSRIAATGDGFTVCTEADGSQTMIDIDGTILASVNPGGDIYPPKNGIYGLSQTEKNTNKMTDFQLFDYETGELLSEPGNFILYYLEQQTERMFIERDGKYAIINKYGEYLSDFIYDSVKKRFNPDYYPFPKAYAIVYINGEEKYIDWDLNIIDLDNYHGEKFVTQCYNLYDKNNNKVDAYYVLESGTKQALYSNITNQIIIPYQDDFDFKRTNGKYLTVINSEKQYGLMDFSGNLIMSAEYAQIDFTNIEDVVYTSKIIDGKRIYSDFNLNRMENIPEVKGVIAEEGILIVNYYEHMLIPGGGGRTLSSIVASELINFAGRNITGKKHNYIQYVDSEFMEDTDGDSIPDTPIDINRNFAIIMLNGKYLDFDGIIVNDRTLVPVREIVEGFGGTVEWFEDTQSVNILLDGNEIKLSINSNIMKSNNVDIPLDVPAQLINGKTMIPLRKLSDTIGATVQWDSGLRCVYIEK